MKKRIDSSFVRLRSRRQSPVVNTKDLTGVGSAGLLGLWRMTMAVLMLGAILLAFSGPAVGQAVNATLLGTVTDSSGAAVANAKVLITETNTGIGRTSQTNDSGNYVFPDLPPGTYRVTAELSGFKRESKAGIGLVVNSTERIDLVLQPGNVSETITVEVETPILQTERADTGRKLESVLTENVPLGTNRNLARPAPRSSTHSSSMPAARCRRKSMANCARATTTRLRASTTTNAPVFCKS